MVGFEKNSGYWLSAENICQHLPNKLRGTEIEVFETIDSTNANAKAFLLSGGEVARLVLAEEQTAGRGRRGKSFYSPKGTGLYMSLALPKNEEQGGTQLVTIAAAVAVCRALEELFKLRPGIKWVNDIYLGGKKLCGILCETASRPESGEFAGIIIGVGVNCTTKEYPRELSGLAASIGNEAVDRNRLAAEITARLFEVFSEQRTDVLEEYRRRSLMEGKRVHFERSGMLCQGKVLGVGENGDLQIFTDDGERISLNSGEVSVECLSDWS